MAGLSSQTTAPSWLHSYKMLRAKQNACEERIQHLATPTVTKASNESVRIVRNIEAYRRKAVEKNFQFLPRIQIGPSGGTLYGPSVFHPQWRRRKFKRNYLPVKPLPPLPSKAFSLRKEKPKLHHRSLPLLRVKEDSEKSEQTETDKCQNGISAAEQNTESRKDHKQPMLDSVIEEDKEQLPITSKMTQM